LFANERRYQSDGGTCVQSPRCPLNPAYRATSAVCSDLSRGCAKADDRVNCLGNRLIINHEFNDTTGTQTITCVNSKTHIAHAQRNKMASPIIVWRAA